MFAILKLFSNLKAREASCLEGKMNSLIFAVIMPQIEFPLSGETVHLFQPSKSLIFQNQNINEVYMGVDFEDKSVL